MNVYISHRGGSGKGRLWKFQSSIEIYVHSITLLCRELSKTGQCLDPGRGGLLSKLKMVIYSKVFGGVFLGLPMPVPYPQSHRPLPNCPSHHSQLLPREFIQMYLDTCAHTHTFASFYDIPVCKNKIRDKPAFYHSILCAGAWLDTQRRLKRRKKLLNVGKFSPEQGDRQNHVKHPANIHRLACQSGQSRAAFILRGHRQECVYVWRIITKVT